jgi:hypothetical protein
MLSKVFGTSPVGSETNETRDATREAEQLYLFIGTGQPRIARDVGRKDRR